MMSRHRIRDLRRVIEEARAPLSWKARKRHQLDVAEGEWTDEVVRRWHRRRAYIVSAPFVALRKALLMPFVSLLERR